MGEPDFDCPPFGYQRGSVSQPCSRARVKISSRLGTHVLSCSKVTPQLVEKSAALGVLVYCPVPHCFDVGCVPDGG